MKKKFNFTLERILCPFADKIRSEFEKNCAKWRRNFFVKL